MPYNGSGIDESFPAAADLSSYQYHFVYIDANGRAAVATGCTVLPIGILQNKPSAADAVARVRIAGISKLEFGAAADESATIASNAQGFGTATTTDTDFYGAIALHAPGGSGDYQDVLIVHGQRAS